MKKEKPRRFINKDIDKSKTASEIINEKKAFEVSEDGKRLSVNKEKAEEFETLMEKSGTKIDYFYYDSKNPIVRGLLIVLGCIILTGCLIILLLLWFM